ncbi:MAG TPA: hypothetical protein VJL35_14515 [Gemmatimonadaceae bacterium]|nr:hypothetical protein [Gemmatimonadaceae bacterium]
MMIPDFFRASRSAGVTGGCEDPVSGNCGATSVSTLVESAAISAVSRAVVSDAAVSTTIAVSPLRARVSELSGAGFVS